MNDPTDLQAQADEVASEQDATRLARLQQIDDLKWLMAHPQGRRIVTRLFERTGIRRTPFNTNGSTMAFNAGAQNVGLWLEAEILETSFDGYMKLLKEFQK
jgi:3-oxoacyl-[acyl-carrier-protein] synthase III